MVHAEVNEMMKISEERIILFSRVKLQYSLSIVVLFSSLHEHSQGASVGTCNHQ